MTPPEAPSPQRLSRVQRGFAVLLGISLLSPLVLAAFLQPNARGYGTHQQLGLPPCSFQMMFGRPCPSCGSTTAFACVVRGRWCDAMRANAGGTVLAILFAAAGPWSLLSAVRGRWLGWTPTGPRVASIAAVITVIMVIGWVIRLCRW